MFILSELPDNLTAKIVEKMKQKSVIGLYKASKFGREMTEKHRKSVLDNYSLLIELVRKKDSPLISRQEKNRSSRKLLQIVAYMKRSLTSESLAPRKLEKRRVSFGSFKYREIREISGEDGEEEDKENIKVLEALKSFSLDGDD